MAREHSVPDSELTEASDDTGSPASRRNTKLLDRRSYLRLAGIAAAGTTVVGAAGRTRAADYDVVDVPAGSHEVLRVGAGETLENVLIDVTADGASATIDCHAPNTTVRNVGFKGRMDDPPTGIIGASDTGGGTSVIENVYLGDGASTGYRDGLGLWVSPEHTGHLIIDRMNVQEMGDNSFYCSAPGRNGTVEIRNCYSANSWVSHYRLAKGTVENCVALNDERHKDGRGIWAWAPGTVEVRDCDLEMNGRHYAIAAGANDQGSQVDVYDTEYSTDFYGGVREANGSTVDMVSGNGTNPDGSRVPEGCPTSAEEAAAGGSSTNENSRTLELSGQFAYRVEVDGELAPAAGHGQYLTRGEAYGDDWAEWWLSGSDEAYTTWQFSGEITSLDISDYDGETEIRSIRIDGETVDPARFVDRPETRALELAGQFGYRIDVDGEIAPAEAHAQWLTEGDAYGTDWAEWWLSGSDEARTVWEFTGEITNIEIDDYDGTTELRTLAVDGEELDHSRYVDTESHTLELEGQFGYRIDVDGEISPAETHAQWLTEGESYGTDWAEWWLSGSDEARTVWEFTGDITTLDVSAYDGETDVRTLAVDGRSVDPTAYD